MPVVIALIFCMVLFAAVLVPFYAYVGLAIYLVWKRARRKADVEAAVARAAVRHNAGGNANGGVNRVGAGR